MLLHGQNYIKVENKDSETDWDFEVNNSNINI